MNRQTRALRDSGQSLRFNKGVDFSHMDRVGGSARHTHPEFTIVPMDVAKGRCVDSHNERDKARRKPWVGQPQARRKDGVPKFRFY